MLSYKTTVASSLVLRVVCNKRVRGGSGCVWGWVGGAHHKNQLNMLPFPHTETDILHYNILEPLALEAASLAFHSMLVKRYNA